MITASAMTLFVVASLSVALLAGCGSAGGDNSDADPNGTPGNDGGSTPVGPTDLDTLRTAAEEAYGSEPWWDNVTEWREVRILGAPTIVVATDLDPTSAEANEARDTVASAILDLEPQFAHNVDVRAYSEAGDRRTFVQLSGAASGGTPMSEQFELPASPQTVTEFQTWMESVYGSGGIVELGDDEHWYDAIRGYTFEIPQGMNEALLVVRTTMAKDDVDAEDMQFYRLQRALQATNSPLLEFYAVLGADDRMLVASSGGAGEPGLGGPQY